MPADVVCSIRVIAAGCGLGEIGFSKVFLTKKFGPRVRLGLIFTDCELEPDPIMDTGEICIHCGACQRECPGNAIPNVRDEEKRLTVDFGDKKIWYGDVHMGRCTLTHHGFNNECSPFHKKEFPNMAFDVRNSEMTEEEAYILCYSMAQAKWFRKPETGKALEYYDYILKHTGYFAICGARGCIRACMNMLEKTNRIENTFQTNFIKRTRGFCPTAPKNYPPVSTPSAKSCLTKNIPVFAITNTNENCNQQTTPTVRWGLFTLKEI